MGAMLKSCGHCREQHRESREPRKKSRGDQTLIKPHADTEELGWEFKRQTGSGFSRMQGCVLASGSVHARRLDEKRGAALGQTAAITTNYRFKIRDGAKGDFCWKHCSRREESLAGARPSHQ